MSQIDKNTVKADNQLGNMSKITYDSPNGTGKRILFVGNSITRHAPKPQIGWHNDWGMAATCKDNDYVHVVQKYVLEKEPDATFCACQVADWEKNYTNGQSELDKFIDARNFDADIIVMRLIENCNPRTFEKEVFYSEYKKLLDYLNINNRAKIIVTSSFWKHPGDDILKHIAGEIFADYIYLGDLGDDSKMRADGLFEHKGVSIHPGDEGMKQIAIRIYDKLEKYI